MEMKTKLRGWLAASNLNISCLGEYQDLGCCYQYDQRLHKFPQDEVFLSDAEGITFLDGYVYNKDNFICPEGYNDWQKSFALSLRKDAESHFKRMRGAFAGYSCEKESGRVLIYTDHVSNKALYYYVENDKWIFSNNVELIARVLRANHILYHADSLAAKYMLTYGYMLDDTTYIKEIRRLLPGSYGVIENQKITLTRYYKLQCREEQMTQEEALERIDAAFRQAIQREFEKDREYGYRHLVDLSGGLDSRMTTVVAHDMGYTDQTNLSYSRLGYRDNIISSKIAKCLGHEYLFKTLDDIAWMYDIDELILQNNGAGPGLGITGGARMLQIVNTEPFGIEHTGMIGGPVMASYYKDKNLAYSKPRYGLNRYSNKLQYDFDEKLLEEYETQEAFSVNTRALLGMQVSYMIRQNYIEASSPFGDVDMLETAFSIPYEYRTEDKLYLEWIRTRYPVAAEFGWEKWGGVKPKKSHIFLRKVKTTQRLAQGYLCSMLHRASRDSMNPLDYWYENDADVRQYFEKMYHERMESKHLPPELINDMKTMYQGGNFTEKQQVLTVLGAIHLYFD